MDYVNHETADERKARRARAIERTSGTRDASGLTAAERALLDELRRSGYALERGAFADDRRAVGYYGNRQMEPAL